MNRLEEPGLDGPDDYDVLIVGGGPVGCLTANLLGLEGIRTAVLERDASPHGQPRAFSCDAESLRICQAAGLVDVVRRDMSPCSRIEYVGADGRVMADIALSEIDHGVGYAPMHFLDQPVFEEVLREGMSRFGHVALAWGEEVFALSQDDERVTIRVRDIVAKSERTLTAKYVLGCDGHRSVTRTLAGISLRQNGTNEPWLAVCGDAPRSAIRCDATRFVCDWRRPTFVTPAALGTYRMEFMLHPEETAASMERLDRIAALIEPYVDPARFTVRRADVHAFQDATAESFRAGRVFLLGDAAHQMPPFMGLGLSSGLRDGANLAWKLARVLRGEADGALLDTYETERRPQIEKTSDASARLGHLFLARSPRLTRMRDAVLRSIDRVPRVRRVLSSVAFKSSPGLGPGFVSSRLRRGPNGTMFPQPRVHVAGERDLFALDAILGQGFAVVGPGVSEAMADDEAFRGLNARFVRVRSSAKAFPEFDAHEDVFDVADIDGTLTEWFARHRADLAVVRPDRFVFGSALEAEASALGRELRAAMWGSAASA